MRRKKAEQGKTSSRRKFLRRAAVAFVGIGGAATLDAWVIEPRWVAVERRSVPIRGLHAAMDGFRIVLVSDTHCGPWTRPSFVRKAVALANAQEPDAMLLLGDYCHRHRRYIGPGIEPFAALEAKEPVLGVLGNHDHWEDAKQTRQELARAGVADVTNCSVILKRGGGCLAIGGVDDLWTGDQEPERAFAGVPPGVPRILMSHNPDYAETLPEGVRVDLMVSGHTHGGQVWLPFRGAPLLPSRYGQKYRAGMVEGPACRVYVTRGIGTISPPVRFLCRPELTVLTLTAAD